MRKNNLRFPRLFGVLGYALRKTVYHQGMSKQSRFLPDVKELSLVAEQISTGAELVSIERLTGGVSADVFRLRLEDDQKQVIDAVLRIHGEHHGGHDLEMEHQLLNALSAGSLPVPKVLYADDSRTLFEYDYLVIEFIKGTSALEKRQLFQRIPAMAQMLYKIHHSDTKALPKLQSRLAPLPEVFDYWPDGARWAASKEALQQHPLYTYDGPDLLLHGDFWPQNLLWEGNKIVAVLDWEDAAVGDPMSDLAAAGLELRYLFGAEIQDQFTQAYAKYTQVDRTILALWQVYVASAAQHFMAQWRLEPNREAHMRAEALACIDEALQCLEQA